jgi:hypothetical protein
VIGGVFRSSVPGHDVLVKLASRLIAEALLASAVDSLDQPHRPDDALEPPPMTHPELAAMARQVEQRKPDATTGAADRLPRHRAVARLVNILEQEIRLEFGDTTLPLVALSQVAKRGGPVGGYLRDHPGYAPSEWVIDLFTRWVAHHQVVANDWNRSKDRQAVRAGSRDLEAARLLRAALSYCWHTQSPDAVATATAFVVGVAESGLCRDAEGAGLAFAMLLRAGSGADTPDSLLRSFFPRVPAGGDEWIHLPLNFPPEPVPLTATTMSAVESLVIRAGILLDQTRQSADFDEWFSRLVRAECLVRCVYYGLEWATPRLPLGLRTVQSQFSELDADYGAIRALLRFSDMTAIVGKFERMAGQFRAVGDTSGDRFARERLLIPRELLGRRDTLPRRWLGPSWRTASVVPHGKSLGDLTPEQALVVRPDIAARWRTLAATLTDPSAAQVAEHIADGCPG